MLGSKGLKKLKNLLQNFTVCSFPLCSAFIVKEHSAQSLAIIRGGITGFQTVGECKYRH
jgi:hypothetical protein